jgi:CRP/FNR family transcriptional regulator
VNRFVQFSGQGGETAKAQPHIKLALTHDEMAQMIGTSRETVTRMFADLTKQQIVERKGSTLRIRNKAGLKALAFTQ